MNSLNNYAMLFNFCIKITAKLLNKRLLKQNKINKNTLSELNQD